MISTDRPSNLVAQERLELSDELGSPVLQAGTGSNSGVCAIGVPGRNRTGVIGFAVRLLASWIPAHRMTPVVRHARRLGSGPDPDTLPHPRQAGTSGYVRAGPASHGLAEARSHSLFLAYRREALPHELWSGRRESNPHLDLGRMTCLRYTTAAHLYEQFGCQTAQRRKATVGSSFRPTLRPFSIRGALPRRRIPHGGDVRPGGSRRQAFPHCRSGEMLLVAWPRVGDSPSLTR